VGQIGVQRVLTAVSTTIKQISRDESGQDLIEYALLAALVGLGAVVSMRGLSSKIGNGFNTIGTTT
jgi:pilus assembly protein Flp/PilA